MYKLNLEKLKDLEVDYRGQEAHETIHLIMKYLNAPHSMGMAMSSSYASVSSPEDDSIGRALIESGILEKAQPEALKETVASDPNQLSLDFTTDVNEEFPINKIPDLEITQGEFLKKQWKKLTGNGSE